MIMLSSTSIVFVRHLIRECDSDRIRRTAKSCKCAGVRCERDTERSQMEAKNQARYLTWCSWFERNNPDFFNSVFPFRAVKINQVPIFNASSTDDPGCLCSRVSSFTTHISVKSNSLVKLDLLIIDLKKNIKKQ